MKAPEAFRSISEVADVLGVPQHTLRAWETRFPFVRPVKREDGRRYYRPADVVLLVELTRLLTEQGLAAPEILRIHRNGGLLAKAQPKPAARRPDDEHLAQLRAHLDALAAVKTRLTSLIGGKPTRPQSA